MQKDKYKEEIAINGKIKKIMSLTIATTVIMMSGCSLNSKQQVETESIESNSIISPEVKASEYYRGVLPYKASPINGMLREIPSRLDSNFFELGLLEMAKKVYDPSTYVFQEGQVLSMNEIEPLLDKDQFPQFDGFLYSVTEHDYLVESGQINGIVIGLLVSSKHYVKNEAGDYVKDSNGRKVVENYSDDEVKELAKKLSTEIVPFIRKKLPDASILFGVMEAQSNDMILPSNFILSGTVKEKETVISQWNDINEGYLFLPTQDGGNNIIYENTAKIFDHFKENTESYLPDFAGVTGLAKFVDDQLVEITLNVNTEFESTVEVIQFTQFSIAMIAKYFPEDSNVNLYINTIDKPKAIYVRKANGDDFMHIYQN